MSEDSKNRTLQFWVLLFRAKAALGKDDATFSSAWNNAFDFGEGLFEDFAQSHPLTDASDNPFLEPLSRLVRLPIRTLPWTVIERIRRTGNDQLKAYLLIEAAAGIERPKIAAVTDM